MIGTDISSRKSICHSKRDNEELFKMILQLNVLRCLGHSLTSPTGDSVEAPPVCTENNFGQYPAQISLT